MKPVSEAPLAEPQPVEGQEADSGGPGAAVELSGVGHSFGELRVLDRIDLHVAAGEVLGIVGPSGCGKSTLLELLAGLSEPADGKIAIDGRPDASERLARAVLMPQRDLLLPWLSAIDNAALAARNRGATREGARGEAHPLFERFGLAGFEASPPRELSGGMRQRVAFLRTLLAGKPVMALDEPFASLDAITRAEMQEWLAGALAAESRTALLVTHDVEEALYLSDRVTVLSPRPGRVVADVRSPAPRSVPRLDAVAAPAFTVAREEAMRALVEAARES